MTPSGGVDPADQAAVFACTGVDESAGGQLVVAELRRTMREGILRALPDDEVSVTLTERGRLVALEVERDRAGQNRLLRDLAWQARLQGDCNE